MRRRNIAPFGLIIVLTGPWTQMATVTTVPAAAQGTSPTDPLPSWNAGASKTAIIDFVTAVTKEGGPQFIPTGERIATFDNDGTLWSEQPMYFQLAFIFDRVKALAADQPTWKTTQPYKAVLDGDMKALAASGEKGLMELMAATHTGMTTDEFTKVAQAWASTARHPRTGRL